MAQTVQLRQRPNVMIIRDGWGFNPNPAEDKFNTVKLARVPVDTMLMTQYPHTLLRTYGEDVGLPDRHHGQQRSRPPEYRRRPRRLSGLRPDHRLDPRRRLFPQ